MRSRTYCFRGLDSARGSEERHLHSDNVQRRQTDQVTWEAPYGQSLWEHHGQLLTAGELRQRLAEAPDDAAILVGTYNGQDVDLRLPVDVSAEQDAEGSVRVVITGGEPHSAVSDGHRNDWRF